MPKVSWHDRSPFLPLFLTLFKTPTGLYNKDGLSYVMTQFCTKHDYLEIGAKS